MTKLQCELCEGEIIKIADDTFQCQRCGCKYTLEQARKLLSGDVTVQPQNFEIIGGELVKYNGSDTNVVIPDGVVIIGEKAFSGSAIQSVVVPSSVRIIKNRAFSNCEFLTDVSLHEGLTDIGGEAFMGCSRLKSIILPETLEAIKYKAFSGCPIKTIDIPSNVKVLGGEAFEGSLIETIKFPDDIETFHFSILTGCNNLKKIELPKNLKISKVGFWNTNGAYNIIELTIPEGCTEIDEKIVDFKPNLERLYIPYSAKIGHYDNHDKFTPGTYSFALTLVKDCHSLKEVNGNTADIEKNAIRIIEEVVKGNSLTGFKGLLNDWSKKIISTYWKNSLRCQHCGGEFSVFDKCKKCGRKKDY